MSGGPTGGKASVLCPRCKFPNSAGSASCLTCGTVLAGGVVTPARRGTATRRLTREDLAKVLVEQERTQAAPAGAASPVDASWPPPPLSVDVSPEDAWAAAVAAPVAPAPPARAVAPVATAVAPVMPAAADPATAVAWLVCEPLPPVAIGPASYVTLGRSDECDLVLAHSSVSRCHAIVRAVSGELHFDDRSTFGSYVNGARQVSVTVRAGDVLTIGPYEVRIAGADLGRSSQRDMGETRPLMTALRDLNSADAMTGRLEKQPLAEVLQTLEFNRKTGTLDLVCGDRTGLLVVYEGAPIHADFGGVSGEEAVHEMVSQAAGYYAFRTKIEPGEQTIGKSMTALLLEASRRIDERG